MAQWGGETSLGGPVSMSDSVSLVNDNLNQTEVISKLIACSGCLDSPKLNTARWVTQLLESLN